MASFISSSTVGNTCSCLHKCLERCLRDGGGVDHYAEVREGDEGVLPWFAPNQSKLLATIPSMTLTVSVLISSCGLAFVCIDDFTGTINREKKKK